eukprot:2109378-Rhodomonas_salina.1
MPGRRTGGCRECGGGEQLGESESGGCECDDGWRGRSAERMQAAWWCEMQARVCQSERRSEVLMNMSGGAGCG